MPHALQSPDKLMSNNWPNNNSSGQYPPSNPLWYSKQIQPQFENRVVADTPFSHETFRQCYPPLSPNAPYSPLTAQQKLQELSSLLGKLSSPWDAHMILELIKFNLSQGNERFLDDRLEQLRMLESQAWRR